MHLGSVRFYEEEQQLCTMSQGSIKTAKIVPNMARTLSASNRLVAVSIPMPVLHLEGPSRVGGNEERNEQGQHQELHGGLIRHVHHGHTDTMALVTVTITWCTVMEHDVAAQILEYGTVDLDDAHFSRSSNITKRNKVSVQREGTA